MRVEDAKRFIIDNARPLELALYRYYYEGTSKQTVVAELERFGNADGGFGHALEPDNWNPASNPIAANDAILTLHRIGALDGDAPIVRGMLAYLRSRDSFDEEKRRWLFAIDSNKDHPHAVWWEKGDGDGIMGFNPTVSLAAFMLRFGEGGEYYAQLVREAFAGLREASEMSGDELKCYMLAYELLHDSGIDGVIDLDEAFGVLQDKLLETICKDTAKYGVEYAPVPSDFFSGRFSRFINEDIRRWIDVERELLGGLQRSDGGFDITWTWHNGYAEFEQAKTWWQARLTVDKLVFFDSAPTLQ